jgi:thymidylate synthase (FAD)
MILVKPSYEIVSEIEKDKILKNIEVIGRTCYKSEYKITKESCYKFIEMLLSNGHESVLEHENISIKFICDRGVSHEIVRHRLASFSQESTRYCNYSSDKFNNELTIIDIRPFMDDDQYEQWLEMMGICEDMYFTLINRGCSPQTARSVLPNSLKTEVVVTANIREWRTIFKQRTSIKAHPQMRQLMIPLLEELKDKLPILFDDINY